MAVVPSLARISSNALVASDSNIVAEALIESWPEISGPELRNILFDFPPPFKRKVFDDAEKLQPASELARLDNATFNAEHGSRWQTDTSRVLRRDVDDEGAWAILRFAKFLSDLVDESAKSRHNPQVFVEAMSLVGRHGNTAGQYFRKIQIQSRVTQWRKTGEIKEYDDYNKVMIERDRDITAVLSEPVAGGGDDVRLVYHRTAIGSIVVDDVDVDEAPDDYVDLHTYIKGQSNQVLRLIQEEEPVRPVSFEIEMTLGDDYRVSSFSAEGSDNLQSFEPFFHVISQTVEFPTIAARYLYETSWSADITRHRNQDDRIRGMGISVYRQLEPVAPIRQQEPAATGESAEAFREAADRRERIRRAMERREEEKEQSQTTGAEGKQEDDDPPPSGPPTKRSRNVAAAARALVQARGDVQRAAELLL